VNQVWIAHASGRIFVAAASPDADRSTLQVAIACFDSGSGARLWEKSHSSKAATPDLQRPVGLFTAQKDSLNYTIGQQRWTVRAGDGSALPPATQLASAEHSWELRGNTGVEIDRATGKVLAEHALLWQPSSFHPLL